MFNGLVEKKLLFKVETRSVSTAKYYGTFCVKRICDDATILSMFNLVGADLTPAKVEGKRFVPYLLF